MHSKQILGSSRYYLKKKCFIITAGTLSSVLRAAVPVSLPPYYLHSGPAKPSILLCHITTKILPLNPGEHELIPPGIPDPAFPTCSPPTSSSIQSVPRHLVHNLIYSFTHPYIHPFKEVFIGMLTCAADTLVNINIQWSLPLKSGIENGY